MNDKNKNRGGGLSDEELAKLLDPELDPGIRNELIARLEQDPERARILGLAAGIDEDISDGFSTGTVDKLLETVRKFDSKTGLCPHCAKDLHDTGYFCPHCGLQVKGDTVDCMNCGKPVVEGSVYCPHCGSVFGELKRRSVVDTRWLMFIVGLACLGVAFYLGPGLPSLIIVLVGLISLLGWLTEFLGLTRTTGKGVSYEIRRMKKKEEKEEDEEGRRLG